MIRRHCIDCGSNAVTVRNSKGKCHNENCDHHLVERDIEFFPKGTWAAWEKQPESKLIGRQGLTKRI